MELSARENERQTQDMKEVEPVDAGRFTLLGKTLCGRFSPKLQHGLSYQNHGTLSMEGKHQGFRNLQS